MASQPISPAINRGFPTLPASDNPKTHDAFKYRRADWSMAELGIRFEANASEAAAAMLAASVHYPIRGAVTFKGPAGVNVASDALAKLSFSGVTSGALIIAGEDYGEGSSIMQERNHAFAMKSQFWLLDPRSSAAGAG